MLASDNSSRDCSFSCPYGPMISGVSDFFRSVPPDNCSVSCAFPDFSDSSDSYNTSHKCSFLCSCHFRIFPTSSDSYLSHKCSLLPVISGSSDFFRFVLHISTLFPFMFLSFPAFGVFDFVRLVPPVSKLFPFLFLSFPDFSGYFRLFQLAPPVTKLFLCMFLSFPDFSDFSRICPTFSGFVRPSQNCIGPLVV